MRRFEFVTRVMSLGLLKNKTIKLPERSTKNSAGYDFFNPEKVTIEPGEIKYVKTGVKARFEKDEVLMLYNRSSNPKKKGLIIPNGVGVIDADYYNNADNEGEMAFAFQNITNEPVIIEVGEKLGQGIFTKFLITNDDAAEGERVGGFGSTNK